VPVTRNHLPYHILLQRFARENRRCNAFDGIARQQLRRNSPLRRLRIDTMFLRLGNGGRNQREMAAYSGAPAHCTRSTSASAGAEIGCSVRISTTLRDASSFSCLSRKAFSTPAHHSVPMDRHSVEMRSPAARRGLRWHGKATPMRFHGDARGLPGLRVRKNKGEQPSKGRYRLPRRMRRSVKHRL
jgi:hypothetical protein